MKKHCACGKSWEGEGACPACAPLAAAKGQELEEKLEHLRRGFAALIKIAADTPTAAKKPERLGPLASAAWRIRQLGKERLEALDREKKLKATLEAIEVPDESGDYLPYADVAIRYSESIVIIGEFDELVRDLVPYLPDVVYRGDPLGNEEAIEVDAQEEEKARSLKKRAADLVDLGEEKKGGK